MLPKICIAEIPIYSTDKKTFEKRWNKHIEDNATQWAPHLEKEAAKEKYRDHLYPRTAWKYSQIIGFLKIELSPNNVWFEVYAPINAKYQYKQITKTFPQNWHMIGTHFRVDGSMENEAIRLEIYDWIRMINREHLKNRYFDLSVFDVISTHINYRKIMDDL